MLLPCVFASRVFACIQYSNIIPFQRCQYSPPKKFDSDFKVHRNGLSKHNTVYLLRYCSSKLTRSTKTRTNSRLITSLCCTCRFTIGSWSIPLYISKENHPVQRSYIDFVLTKSSKNGKELYYQQLSICSLPSKFLC